MYYFTDNSDKENVRKRNNILGELSPITKELYVAFDNAKDNIKLAKYLKFDPDIPLHVKTDITSLIK